jgi:hypothetical protein
MAMTANTITVDVPSDVAHGLLEVAQFERDARGRWVAPTGKAYWQTDEALTYALPRIAEALGGSEASAS